MNRALIVALVATLGLTAWALIRPASPPDSATVGHAVGALSLVPTTPAASAVPSPVPPLQVVAETSSLPAHWPESHVDSAVRSPFLPPQPRASSPVSKSTSVAVAVASAPAPTPIADYRFWGRFAGPGGRRLIYVARGSIGAPVEISAATRLEDGWSVDAVSDNAVVLIHAVTQQRSTVSIPVEAPLAQN